MRTLSAARVVEDGVALVAEQGWTRLSLRSIAARLDVTPMALYRHVADGDSLRAAVLEQIVGRVPKAPRSGVLTDDLTSWAHEARAALATHPGVSAHLLTTWFDSPAMLAVTEDLLDLVASHGLTDFTAVATVNAVIMHVLMRVEAERAVRDAGVVRRTLRLARADRELPHLVALRRHYTTAALDEHFAYGLRALVAGLRIESGWAS